MHSVPVKQYKSEAFLTTKVRYCDTFCSNTSNFRVITNMHTWQQYNYFLQCPCFTQSKLGYQ